MFFSEKIVYFLPAFPHSSSTSRMVLHTSFQNKISSLYNTQFTIPGKKTLGEKLNHGERSLDEKVGKSNDLPESSQF
jgi:hypothetical protein